ncbi:MAG TPA: response regulator [Kineosporiaceae bacterium]|nr:response regulator [Kineosporiaceae bacterium]
MDTRKGSGGASHSEMVLLVEDNVDDVFLTTRALQKVNLGRQIVVARDGVEALDLLFPANGRTPLRPMIILLDILMPRIGGLEVLVRLRSEEVTRSLPVIVLTTSPEERDLVDGDRLGVISYLSKPVQMQEFLTASMALGLNWGERVSPEVARCG